MQINNPSELVQQPGMQAGQLVQQPGLEAGQLTQPGAEADGQGIELPLEIQGVSGGSDTQMGGDRTQIGRPVPVPKSTLTLS